MSDKDAFDPAVMFFLDIHRIDGADFADACEYYNLTVQEDEWTFEDRCNLGRPNRSQASHCICTQISSKASKHRIFTSNSAGAAKAQNLQANGVPGPIYPEYRHVAVSA